MSILSDGELSSCMSILSDGEFSNCMSIQSDGVEQLPLSDGELSNCMSIPCDEFNNFESMLFDGEFSNCVCNLLVESCTAASAFPCPLRGQGISCLPLPPQRSGHLLPSPAPTEVRTC